MPSGPAGSYVRAGPAQLLGERAPAAGVRTRTHRVGVAVDELADRALLDQPAPADDDEVVGHQRHLRQQVAADEHRACPGGRGARGRRGSSGCPRGRARWPARRGSPCAGRRAARRRARAAGACRASSRGPCAWRPRSARPGRAPRRPARRARRCWPPASAGGCDRSGPGGRSRRRAARRPRTAAGANDSKRLPSNVVVPRSGRSRPSMQRIVVLLPDPFGPRKPVTRPGVDVEAQVVDGERRGRTAWSGRGSRSRRRTLESERRQPLLGDDVGRRGVDLDLDHQLLELVGVELPR